MRTMARMTMKIARDDGTMPSKLRALFAKSGDLPPAATMLFPHPLAWATLAGLSALAAAWFAISPLRFVVDEDMRNTLVSLAVVLPLAAFVSWRGFARLGAFLFTLPFFVITGILGRALNYLFVLLALPLQDDWLARADAVLGFDWVAAVMLVDSHPWLASLLRFAYASYAWLLPLTFLLLTLMGRLRRLREFLLLFTLTGFATMAIGGLLPALGAFEHFRINAADLATLPPETGRTWVPDMLALQAGTFRDFVVAKADGLTAFPSFHAVMALLFAFAFRGTILHWPMFLLSVLVMVATPVFGGHYFVDLLGGVAIFILFVALFRRLGLLDETSAPARESMRPAAMPAE